jgi:hypothetical protein
MSSFPAFRYSIRELVSFVTFVGIILAMSVSAGDATLIVVMNGALLLVAVLIAGPRLYGWIMAAAVAVPSIVLVLLLQLSDGNVGPWREFVPDMLVIVCFGSVCGATVGLWRAGKELLGSIAAIAATFDFLWLLMPRIQ